MPHDPKDPSAYKLGFEIDGVETWAICNQPSTVAPSRFTQFRAISIVAVACFEKFGKARHPAALNFGDCVSYACAKANGALLLFEGDDFAQTDINQS